MDQERFGPAALPALRAAAADLGWLLERGYSPNAALKLVGDRHGLARRQRKALMRGVCAPSVARARMDARHPLTGATVAVDGFNVLVTLETALRGELLVRGVDGLLRDLAGMHGRYRQAEHTERALELLTEALRATASARWVLDRPVSNSGRLAARLRAMGFEEVLLTDYADRELAQSGAAIATADGPLLDRAGQGVDLIGPIVASLPESWIVSLQEPPHR